MVFIMYNIHNTLPPFYSFQRRRPVAEIAGGVVSIRLKLSFFLGRDSVLDLVSRSLLRFGSVAVELLVSDELRTEDKSSFKVDFFGRVSELVRSLRFSFCSNVCVVINGAIIQIYQGTYLVRILWIIDFEAFAQMFWLPWGQYGHGSGYRSGHRFSVLTRFQWGQFFAWQRSTGVQYMRLRNDTNRFGMKIDNRSLALLAWISFRSGTVLHSIAFSTLFFEWSVSWAYQFLYELTVRSNLENVLRRSKLLAGFCGPVGGFRYPWSNWSLYGDTRSRSRPRSSVPNDVPWNLTLSLSSNELCRLPFNIGARSTELLILAFGFGGAELLRFEVCFGRSLSLSDALSDISCKYLEFLVV